MDKSLPDNIVSNRRSVARAAGIIGLGNVLSRVLGLARDSTIAHFFGPTGLVSALTLARQIPQWIFDLLVGGHIGAECLLPPAVVGVDPHKLAGFGVL